LRLGRFDVKGDGGQGGSFRAVRWLREWRRFGWVVGLGLIEGFGLVGGGWGGGAVGEGGGAAGEGAGRVGVDGDGVTELGGHQLGEQRDAGRSTD
jgi:hypothetical protein